ncbi:MAG: class I SAM-dependent methyltransferase [Lachnospiraceae bacterium]|nr:class I SAM-dependent methyltransferase [Lachnospiraceae bacterium]
MEKKEQIGKITLDYSKYPGEDFYCDGAVEDELLRITRDMSPVEYAGKIEESKSWPILYHLSPLRENIVEWLPIGKEHKVLEVGSGCGAITGALAAKAGEVTCVDLSQKRSMINAYRHSECENVTIHVGNFKDIEPQLPGDYDYICLIGVFEYGQSYIGGKTPYEDFLRILQGHLKPDGRIVIAIENKLGMKYFAGCREDHLGTYFSGIENYAGGGGVRTFSRNGLERIFAACGVKESHFYYPYPDYKFMTTLFSDAYQPGKGELSNNLRNFDRDRMLLFNEKQAFDGVTEDGLFPIFSNSFLVVLGADFDVKYTRYSNDRAPAYCIRTEIGETPEGRRYVRKYPLGPEAAGHVRGMAVAYESLKERYAGSSLQINQCTLVDTEGELYAEFEFVKGRPLSQLLDECLENGDMDGFYDYFCKYVEKIDYNSQAPVADFDLVFSNILVDGEDWTLIDYEWTFGKPVATKELAFRAIYCYLLEDEKRGSLELDRILELLQITQEDAQQLREQEQEFQSFVTGNRRAMAQMRDLIGYRILQPGKWIDRYQDAEQINRVQIYEDLGSGYREEASYFVKDAYQGENLIEMEIPVSGNVKMLRIDPSMDSCMVKILELTFNGVEIPLQNKKNLLINGRLIKAAGKEEAYHPSMVFATTDPNINLVLEGLERRAENRLYARMEVVRLPMKMAQDMAGAVKRII